MRAFKVYSEIHAVDKASKIINKIATSAQKMAKTVTRESMASGNAFSRFASSVGIGVKRAQLALNNLNAKINTIGRNIKNKLGTLGLAVGFTAITMLAGNTINKFADFEQANASLASVLSSTTQPKLIAMQNDAKRLGAITAKTATEVVGLQEAFGRLGFSSGDIINMTESTIAGSVAMQGALSDTAELVGAMVKSFDQFESINAPQIIDQLTRSTQASALNFEKLQTSLPIVAGAANAAQVPFTKLLSSLGKLSDAGIDASSSSTALRNIFLKSAAEGVPYEKLLQKVSNSTDQLATANELFGARGAVAAVILAKNAASIEELDKTLQNAAGTAQTAATKQLDTLKGSITILGSAWEGFILNIEDGQGAISGFLKDVVRTTTEILSMATGTAKAKDEMTEAELRIRGFAETSMTVLKVVKAATFAFVGFKIAVVALRAATFAYNVVLGIQSALIGSATIAMRGNAVAIWTMNAATKAMAAATAIYNLGLSGAIAATWAFTSALLANPITWVVVGIGALITGIVLLVKHFDKVKSAVQNAWQAIENNRLLQLLILPIYTTVKAIQFLIQGIKYLINNWDELKTKTAQVYATIKESPFQLLIYPIIATIDMIKTLIISIKMVRDAFKFGSLKDGFKAIGMAIFNFMISPIKTLLEGLAKIPGVGKLAQKGLDAINKFQDKQANRIDELKTKAAENEIKLSDNTTKHIIDNQTKPTDYVTRNVMTENNQELTAFETFKKETSINTTINDITKNKVIENEAIKTNASDKLTDAMLLNAKITDENNQIQKANKDEWKGKFKTYIVKNENVIDRNISNEIAKTAIVNEKNVINQQKQVLDERILNTEISKNILNKETNIINKSDFVKESEIVKNISNVSEFSTQKEFTNERDIQNVRNESTSINNRNQKQELTIYVVDKTGNKFAVEVEGTGLNVKTTGNV